MKRYRIETVLREVDAENPPPLPEGDAAVVRYGYDIEVGDDDAERNKAERHLYRAMELAMAGAHKKARE